MPYHTYQQGGARIINLGGQGPHRSTAIDTHAVWYRLAVCFWRLPGWQCALSNPSPAEEARVLTRCGASSFPIVAVMLHSLFGVSRLETSEMYACLERTCIVRPAINTAPVWLSSASVNRCRVARVRHGKYHLEICIMAVKERY